MTFKWKDLKVGDFVTTMYTDHDEDLNDSDEPNSPEEYWTLGVSECTNIHGVVVLTDIYAIDCGGHDSTSTAKFSEKCLYESETDLIHVGMKTYFKLLDMNNIKTKEDLMESFPEYFI